MALRKWEVWHDGRRLTTVYLDGALTESDVRRWLASEGYPADVDPYSQTRSTITRRAA